MRLLAPLLLIGIELGQALGGDIQQDFRKEPVNDELFRLQGPDADTNIRSEPEGLRITLRAAPKPATLGLHSRFHLGGDFVATTGYEILQAKRPAAGDGIGLEIYLNTATDLTDAVVFRRVAHATQGEIYLC